MRRVLAGAVAAAIALAAVPGIAQDKLTVWWAEGIYKSEDEALYVAIRKYERKTGVKIELLQFAVQDMIAKTVAALDAGTVPDIAYSDTYDGQTAGKWAFDGKLEDLSDVLGPMKDRFDTVALSTANLYSDKTKKKAYYAFPIKQRMLHVQYWKDMLGQAGFKENDIPDTWKEYWSFWCNEVQPGVRKATGQPPFGTGFPMGVESTDSFQSFLTWVDAYNVRLVDDSGKLLVDDPKVKEGLVSALADYTRPYIAGCTPPSSTTWKDPDNDVAFHNKTTVMTHDDSISIAVKWLDDANNASLTAEQRAAGRKAYDELIATSGFPKKPDGSPMIYRTAVKVGVIFEASKNKAKAKEFLAFLMQEDNLRPHVEGALGRWFPVTRESQESPFWQADRHRKAVYDQFKAGTTPFEFTKNWKFTILNRENAWAKAMKRVVNDKVSVDTAVDELIVRIKEVAS
ncbi:MAG: carbohydrate ABC transporter substrate-binding protein [Enhydrobacter sp.]|nr:carbohydrate ABC transporter substrate-binding protein [Enhydrobacter sp.]